LKILVVTRPCEFRLIPINFLGAAYTLKFIVLWRILILDTIIQ
jgi:hypothetical protein